MSTAIKRLTDWAGSTWWKWLLILLPIAVLLFGVALLSLRGRGQIPNTADAELEAAQNNANIEQHAQQQANQIHQEAAQQTATTEAQAQRRRSQTRSEADKLRQEAEQAQTSEDMRGVLDKLLRRK